MKKIIFATLIPSNVSQWANKQRRGRCAFND